MVAQYGKGQRDDSSRSRAAAETGRHDWTQQVTVSMSPSNSLTTSGRRPMAAALPKGSGFPRPYPSIGGDDDPGTTAGDGNASNDKGIEGLLAKVPPTVWQPNAVVRLHRRKANLYWALLLLGYITYIIFVSRLRGHVKVWLRANERSCCEPHSLKPWCEYLVLAACRAASWTRVHSVEQALDPGVTCAGRTVGIKKTW